MKISYGNILADLFLSKYKVYRYYLFLNALKNNYPMIKTLTAPIVIEIEKKIKRNPFSYLLSAALIGIVIGKICRD